MIEKANCAVVVVTYYPTKDNIEHIESLCDRCKAVILVDNTPVGKSVQIRSYKNLVIKRFGNNRGLARALNQGMKLAHDQGCENIFLLDQDSKPQNDYFDKMLLFKERIEKKYDFCAYYVPNFFDRNSQTYAKFPIIKKYSLHHVTCEDLNENLVEGILIAITSGMLISYSRYREIGLFPKDYFIDFIDNAYALKAAKKGMRIAVNCDALLDHAIGNRKTHRALGLTIKPNHHAPVRRYYIARNGLRSAIIFGRIWPAFAFLIGLRFLHELVSIALYEKEKKVKIRAFLFGCWHGILGYMGEYRYDQN